MSKYLVLIEKTSTGYSAHSPDLPGCIATGESIEDVRRNIKEAIQFHIEGLRAEGLEIPKPATTTEYVDIAA